MADSYIMGEEAHRDTACFSYLNNSIINDRDIKHKRDYYIVLENYKYCEYSKEDLDLFLSSIKEIGVIDFTEIYVDDELHLKLNYSGQNKSYLQYTGMVIRCLYENQGANDFFHVIGKHFINLCKFFKEIDKGLLFTLACNIFCVEYNVLPNKSNYGFNANHILMLNEGCKIFTVKKIIEQLDKNAGINYHFSQKIIKNNYKLEDRSKESYLKLIERNGIK